jgi:hypothetical protein
MTGLPLQRRQVMSFSIVSQDSWGQVNVGNFASLEQAREAFQAICNDRWFIDDGTVRAVLLVEATAEGPRTLDSHAFRA